MKSLSRRRISDFLLHFRFLTENNEFLSYLNENLYHFSVLFSFFQEKPLFFTHKLAFFRKNKIFQRNFMHRPTVSFCRQIKCGDRICACWCLRTIFGAGAKSNDLNRNVLPHFRRRCRFLMEIFRFCHFSGF